MKLTRKASGRRSALAVAILLVAAVAQMTGLPSVPSAAATGVTEPGLSQLVAILLPSVVNITTTRYEAVDIPPDQAVMAQVAKPDKSIWSDAYRLPGPWGSIVVKVADGSPAAQVNLRPGDIITSFEGKFAPDTRALLRDIVEMLPGTTVDLARISHKLQAKSNLCRNIIMLPANLPAADRVAA